jgi:hypothetical protein
MSRSIRLMLAMLALCGLAVVSAGCGGTNNVGTLGNFVITFSGFTPHIGNDFYLKVVDVASGGTVGLATPTAITSDGFSVTLHNIIVSGRAYRVDFWADMDDNGIADRSPNGTPAGVDHTWRLTGTGTASGLAMTFAHDTNWTDITPF